ncbi:MAG TPA: guanylate kinase [Candidatus Cloacimonadota bacterium]|jgi:guanylate kinase|nr:guanylate kinase [Candidatus Cloacimonadota bacterium]HOD53502.1 guanylate kinase [Candidatus Cloacimonadota bacterium]HPM01959.1 guanylate kinase [Candidatus Cloacimonadota bacterium]
MKKKGFLITIAAPSGSGKSTILSKVMERLPHIQYSISHTTRKPRGEEKDGVAYFFTEESDFLSKRDAGFFLESAKVHNNWYGTSKQFIEDTLEKANHVIMDIDVQGVAQIRNLGVDIVSIFILPPSYSVLKQRLIDRKTDSPEQIEQRLENSKKEIDRLNEYDYLVINDSLDSAVECVINIIQAEENKVKRFSKILDDFYN